MLVFRYVHNLCIGLIMEGLKKTLNASQDNSLHYIIDVKEKSTLLLVKKK